MGEGEEGRRGSSMVSWVSLTALLLVAAVLLCSEPGGAVARRENHANGLKHVNGRGRWRKQNRKRKGARTGKKTARKAKSMGRQTESKFNHCDYLDLVEVGYREGSTCAPGGKFLFKAAKGVRRQFLMTAETNIAVFLKHGEKIDSCNDNFNDITTSVKCKAMDGVMKMTIRAKTGGASCAQCPARQPTEAPDDPADMMTGSATTVTCKCPEERNFICTTKVESTANMHTITCNKMTETTIACGSDLVGAAILVDGLLSIDKSNHQLCSSNDYTAILTDYKWRCKDPDMVLAASSACPGDPVVDDTPDTPDTPDAPAAPAVPDAPTDAAPTDAAPAVAPTASANATAPAASANTTAPIASANTTAPIASANATAPIASTNATAANTTATNTTATNRTATGR